MIKITNMAARIHPNGRISSTDLGDLPHCRPSSERQVFTVWMKSLIMNSNGCTVFDSSGRIVYRVDNYECKHSSEVHLMDAEGKVLITIVKKKFRLLKTWEGYRSTAANSCFKDIDHEKKVPLFQVSRRWRGFCQRGGGSYQVRVWIGDGRPVECYCMDSERFFSTKSATACKISKKPHDGLGRGDLVAEVKHKQSSSGVLLGDDVLTFAVEPGFDHSLAVGLLLVHGLFNHKL